MEYSSHPQLSWNILQSSRALLEYSADIPTFSGILYSHPQLCWNILQSSRAMLEYSTVIQSCAGIFYSHRLKSSNSNDGWVSNAMGRVPKVMVEAPNMMGEVLKYW